jgi:hypothetical protein
LRILRWKRSNPVNNRTRVIPGERLNRVLWILNQIDTAKKFDALPGSRVEGRLSSDACRERLWRSARCNCLAHASN